MLLPFEEQAVADLLADPNGGLVVVSSGLRLTSIVTALLSLHSPSNGTLLLLSLPDSLKPHLDGPTPIADVSGDAPAASRAALYSSGAVVSLSARALAADLLMGRLNPSSVSALLVFSAHRLSETSSEAFIARLLRSGPSSRLVPIYAFSDCPHAMTAGFAKAERIMKSLFVRKLHLWPRFHVLVSEDLEKHLPEVVDVRVPMSPAMKGIQDAVLEAMGACLKELRKTNKVDVEDLTVEKGLFKSFDEIVRRQLDPIWHTLGKKTKQLVSDLRTLRKLLDYLVRYDAVTYLKYLDTLRVSEGAQSVWILAESSHKIFELAKRRVYQVLRADGTKVAVNNLGTADKKRKLLNNKKRGKEDDNEGSSKNGEKFSNVDSGGGVVLDEILDEAPKWKVLRELLEEIEEERQQEPHLSGSTMTEDAGELSNIVLIACKDEGSCLQLEEVITKGPQKVMRTEWERYLLGKAELHGLQKRKKKRSQEPKGIGVLDGAITGFAPNAEAGAISVLEKDALLAAASELSTSANEEDIANENGPNAQRGIGKGRRKGKSRKKMPIKQTQKRSATHNSNDNTNVTALQEPLRENIDELKDESHKLDNEVTCAAKPLPPVQYYALDSDQHILGTWKPSVIIVYHPDMSFVREVEVYNAENPSMRLKVYFLFYEESTEVQKFEASIRRENGAFESLIRQKSLMMIPVDQNGRCLGPNANNGQEPIFSQNSITRKAGGRKAPEKETQVIVDMREFMSSLPNVLHLKGMRIIPVTLEVGDYVLSPLICVERKSIGDLFQSFASGRLYNQVEIMSRYYKIPVLLIEFSQDKSFSFQSASEIGDDVSPKNIISKLSLLVLHFPRLRIVWSRSLHATADIFMSLKANQDEPDENKAIRVGVPSEDGIVEDDVRAENYNTSAIEFLRRLPGVTDSNYRAIMDGCNSLSELALLPVEKLAELMQSQRAARTLKEFLDAKCPTML